MENVIQIQVPVVPTFPQGTEAVALFSVSWQIAFGEKTKHHGTLSQWPNSRKTQRARTDPRAGQEGGLVDAWEVVTPGLHLQLHS
jgi:hypothetical protein